MNRDHLRDAAVAAGMATLLVIGWAPPRAVAQLPLLPAAVVSTPLPLEAFADVLVDHRRDRVLVTGGANDNKIVVIDYEGQIIQTVAPLPAAAGMVLLGDRLFVARAGGAAIDVLDAESLERVRTYRLREASGGRLVHANGRLWTSGGECGGWEDLQSVDLDTGRVRIDNSYSLYCSTFFSTPANPHLVMTGTVGLSPAKVTAWDSSRRPVWGRESDHGDEMGTGDISFSPDGLTFLSALRGATQFRLSNLEQTGVRYPVPEGATAVAQTEAEEGYVAVGSMGEERNLYVFRKGETTPASSYLLTGGAVASRSIRFAPDGGRIFAITHDPYAYDEGAEPVFHTVLSGPKAVHSSIDLAIPVRRVGFGRRVPATVRLGQGQGGTTVRILEIPFGGRAREVASGRTNDSGSVTLRVRPERNSTYVAVWDGDDQRLPAVSRPLEVRVRPKVTLQLRRYVARSGRNYIYRVGRPIEMIGRSRPIPHGRRLGFQIQVFVRGRWWPAGTIRDRIGRSSDLARDFIYANRPASFRIRAVVAGAWDRLPSRSSWRYLVATR